MDTLIAALSTMNVELGPAAGAEFPTASDAVFAAILMPMVPVPVIEEMVTVRVAVPVPLTLTVPFAVPVRLSEMLPAASVTAFALPYATV